MKNPILRIISFTGRFWKWYLFMGFFVIAVSLLNLAGPLISKLIVDHIVLQVTGKPQPFSILVTLLILYLLSDVAITILTTISQWVGDIFTEKLQTFLSKHFYEHVLDLHIGFYDNTITGQITNKMTRGIESITNFIQNMLNNFLPFLLTAVVTIILLAKYSLIIAALLAVLFPLYIVISHRSTKAWGKYEAQKNAVRDSSQGRVFESISAIRIVKSFGTQAAELASFLGARKNIEQLAKQQTKEWHMYDFLRRFALNIILFAIFAYVIYWTFQGRYTIGEMTLLLQLVNQARFPLFAMSFILGQIQQASSGSQDYFDILSKESAIHDEPQATSLSIEMKPNQPLLQFKNVSFEYEEKKAVLHDLTFSVKNGEKFALVGESGEGKSTIANLILRFYDPQSGTISIAGHDIRTLTQESLHAAVAVVLQESLLFSGTIFDNIAYGHPNATTEEVIAAAKAANAHEFIEKLPDQYDSLIGERGVKLSGGQKQRISIARAILKNAPIIILDEATSALDSRSELAVQKGLDELLKNRTSIIIAHRLSTIANADHILVLSQGKVAQTGTPKELLKDKEGLYYQLVNLQSQLLKAPSEKRKAQLKQFDLVG
ncbi:iron ABC transporter ATP-binding protein [Candidatus Cerribacteria bacterium 'Amazon FNV 2010 28 9']|uniref:Iron ABC transporter ATP-binding protein n=1 Tax=Candidatus Cerribacteria bacterium 'Amazon FNV 2010 28 9' TaxID=2081795 RepID=A0A317JNR4_9BACT|nr:MAG: iron ABC transporter ATP-binding protein [Candidatus Cerribacteria bacterium 'Amazon FNV 2010 28 9']